MNKDKIKKNEIKRGLECCAAVGSETSCSDCPYRYRCKALAKDALDLIIEQEKELEIEKKAVAKEILQRLYDKRYKVQGLRECVAHITLLDILILAKEYGVEVEE